MTTGHTWRINGCIDFCFCVIYFFVNIIHKEIFKKQTLEFGSVYFTTYNILVRWLNYMVANHT